MNERIKQLISEADAYAWSVDNKYVARDCCNDGEVNYMWEDAFREKFAELIVKECADAADMAYDARCEFVGDYVGEYMGYGKEHGITAWRTE